MIRAAILGAGGIALLLLASICIPRHLPKTPAQPMIPASFHARIENGTLTLRGTLPNTSSLGRILQGAHARFDPIHVQIVDQLTVDSKVSPAQWIDSLPAVLPVLQQMNGRGSMIIDGRSLVLSGKVASEQAKSNLLRGVAPITVGLELEDHILASVSTAQTPTRQPRASLQARLNAVLSRNRIEFESNQASLTAVGRATLDQLVPILRDASSQAEIEIAGHTDGYGAPDYNLALSRRRAEAVREYFVKHGLTQRFVPVGYGSTKPQSNERTQAALKKNRRIELQVKGNGDA
jgi:OOP family OmpA-OmpF porin